jgi:hypothetical protein
LKSEGYPGNSTVTFELFLKGNKTRLKATTEELEPFPSSPDFANENFGKGWKAITGENLKEFLEKES